ncbi:MAG: hypothetical protein EOS38_18495 [Mesorhizobium sp.]|nr:MAG: hypothetical protein EOS38_18495 [Mesorhizobium sp.]TKB14090.1 MAG: hypothetical protein E5V75_20005 [Mesorhizobium sp.]
MASSDISDNLTNDPLATPDSTVTGSTDPTSSDAVPPLAVAVDQADADYAPGETVGITATDVEDGGSLTFLVAHHSAGADGILGTADDVLTYDLTATGTPWVVTDGGAGDLDGVVNGTIQTSWYVNADAANQAFTLTATDQADGRVATVNFTDAVNAPTYDLTFKTTVTINGALFSSSDVVTGAGTGLLDPFVRISASGNNTSEQGYNTDFNAFILDNTSKGGSQYVHSVNIADIPIQFINGVGYYRFDLDINESNVATSQNLSLDSLQIWQASAGDLHDYAPGATPSQGTGAFPAGDNASLIYNLDAGGDKFVGLNGELQPGSGNTTDMSLLVPISNFDPTKPYIYLYSGFGYQTGTYQGPGETAQSTWTADSGFEEWNRQIGQVIDGHKFNDLNADHVWQAGEPALSGWTIYLDINGNNSLDLGEPSTVTDANGYYHFTVTPGTYTIREVQQAGWSQDAPNNAQGEYTVTLAAGEESHNNDFGNFQLGSISGHKYEDADGSLATTGDETAVSGWTITLYNDANHNNTADAGEQVAQTTTDGSGFYQFTGLLPGDYLIKEESQSGWTNVSPVQIDQNNLTSGQNLTNQDFVNFEKFSISGTKYEDLTGDGKSGDDTAWSHDPVTIFIDDDNSGDLSAGDRTTTTDASGNWSIGGLTLADVGKNIYEVVPGGSEQTGVLVQTIDNPGSGGTDSGNDFTNFVAFSISGTKYEDLTGDGKSGDDTAWSHDPVTIFIDDDNSGDLSAGDRTTTTDASGNWSIGGLTLADVGKNIYEVVPGGSEQTGVLVQTIDNPGSGGTDSGNDFTNFVAFSISGTKYEDLSGDGKTADDIPWSHDPVTIYIDENGNHVFDPGVDLSTTTDASGNWSIGGLTLADVGKSIYEVVPTGSQQTGILVQTVDNPGSGGIDTGNDFTNFLPPPGQGLTPGFWKNHLDILTQELGEFHSGWTSNTSFETIFGFQNLSKIPGTPSIADALGAHGGGVNHLERSSAAAFLSAAVTAVPDGPGGKPELNFSFSAATSSNPAIIAILNQIDANHDHTLQPGEVTAAVRDVLNDTGAPTSNFGLTGQPGIEDIASAFDAMNNQTHPDASVFLI